MKKVYLYFFAFGIYVLTAIGGVLASIFSGVWPIAIIIVILALYGYPKAMEFYHNVTDHNNP